MTSFDDASMPGKIYSCFDELKNAEGYILDVRGNSGGSSGNADAIAAMFISGDFHSCYAETQIYEPAYKAWSMFREDFKDLSPDEALLKYADDAHSLKTYRMRKNIYYARDEGNAVTNSAPGKLDGPVAVLMNQYTFSAAEDFVDVMKMYTNAVFVGNNTAGSSGQPLCEPLESGGFFRICTRRCIAQNGEDIYNKGFTPDIRIIPAAEDIASGRDVVLEKGLEIIRKST
jgi:C-terminal processing protease CtpA/Prc